MIKKIVFINTGEKLLRKECVSIVRKTEYPPNYGFMNFRQCFRVLESLKRLNDRSFNFIFNVLGVYYFT